MKLALVMLALLLPAGQALAQDQVATPAIVCTPAVMPAPYAPAAMPAKPVMPSCINPDTHVSKCARKVLDKYNGDVDAYNIALQDLLDGENVYVAALNKYLGDANAYSNCEIRRMNALVTAAN